LPVRTIYLGGGTPSLIPVPLLTRLLDALRRELIVRDEAEITIECHPGHFDREALRTLCAAGLTRLSIGVQSFDDDDLALLGREHTGEQALRALEAARDAEVKSVSIDLIYALPGRSAAGWDTQVARAVHLAPDHIAAYVLTFEPDTPFTARRDRGELEAATTDDEAALFLRTHERLGDAGYAPYEASNFARAPEHRCVHNQGYWERRPYLGLGPSAHSFRGSRRWTNARDLPKWLARLHAGELPTADDDELTPSDEALERWFLGLRTARGVALTAHERTRLAPAIADLVARGLAVDTDDALVLTSRGMAVSEDVAVSLAQVDDEAGRAASH
jgi:oxygen-independent coproporphyrinogen-3 oxidase